LNVRKIAERTNDPNAVWFTLLFTYRYYRFFLTLYAFWRYKPSAIPENPTLSPEDVTLVQPTRLVSESENSGFEECLTTWLLNTPAKIIIVTDTEERAMKAKERYLNISAKILDGSSLFIKGLGAIDISAVKVEFLHAGIADKRSQMAMAIPSVQTELVIFFDDHVFVKPRFLRDVVAAFEDPYVGLCGTKKSVRRRNFRTGSSLGNYWASFWNFLGIAYLVRHNFEIRATNSMDGGVFVVSGRAMVVRTRLVVLWDRRPCASFQISP
jgi:hypothetical protein